MPFWKHKLDPGLPKLIRLYLKVLSYADLPNVSGWIILDDYYIDKLEKRGLKGWFAHFEKLEKEESNINLSEHLMKYKNMDEAERNVKKREIKECLLEEMQGLPDESRKYYMQAFEFFFSDKNIVYGTDQIPERVRRYFGDVQLLLMHKSYIEDYENIAKGDQNNVQIGKDMRRMLNKPATIYGVLYTYYDAVARLVFKKSLNELIRQAKKGDEESFFNLIRIDRTVIGCEWALILVRRAQLKGDQDFFEKMSKAISTSPLENRRWHGELHLVLGMFWKLGLDRLTNPELIELLEDCDIAVQQDPESFRKFVDREIKSYFS